MTGSSGSCSGRAGAARSPPSSSADAAEPGAEHSQPYDEVVLILRRGVAHIGGTEHELEPGICLHLPPGLLHCLENPGPDTMRVLGVFHPADSPAAKLQERG